MNPFDYLGSAAGKVVMDAWSVAMLALWNAGLWLLRLVLGILDAFTTPDLSEDGPARPVYQATFWMAAGVMLILTLAQLGIAAFRRDGRSIAQVLIGAGQFLMTWVAWIGYGIAIVAACGGLSTALMRTLLDIEGWAQFSPLGTQITAADRVDATVATVLGIMGLFLVFAAVGHLLVMLTRAGALIVLSATTPISAAGLTSEVGRAWFWKSFRWFHAAALTPVLMILVLGIGVQLTSNVATGMTDQVQAAVGTAVPGVILICIGCFSPLALFKLLAFTEPGTTSGAALRAGVQAQGGIGGLLRGKANPGGGTSSAASSTDEHGRSQGENAGQAATDSRFGQAPQGGAAGGGRAAGGAGFAGGAGHALAAGLGAMQAIGTRGATVGADLANQMGVGHNNYVPDFTARREKNKQAREDDNPEINGSGHDRPPNGQGSTSGPEGGGDGGPEQIARPDAATGTRRIPVFTPPAAPSTPGAGGGPAAGTSGGGAGAGVGGGAAPA